MKPRATPTPPSEWPTEAQLCDLRDRCERDFNFAIMSSVGGLDDLADDMKVLWAALDELETRREWEAEERRERAERGEEP